VHWQWLRTWSQPGALHPRHTVVDNRLVQWAKRQGYRVNERTVKDAGEMKRLAAMGVDAIITSRPEVF